MPKIKTSPGVKVPGARGNSKVEPVTTPSRPELPAQASPTAVAAVAKARPTRGRPASPGKSAMAPGQRKKALGLKSARSLAPGRNRKRPTRRDS